jgi:hypothetical protein
MANIYLRVPNYVAAFYRHRDENHPLTEWQPIEFCDFSFETRLMSISMVPDSAQKHPTVLCYSQSQWKNILAGKLPIGGKVIMIRDKDKWPTTQEIVLLEGRSVKPNEEIFDYLCIAAPKEVMVGHVTAKADSHYTLTPGAAQQLSNVLRDEYYHYYFEWCQQEERLFRKKGIELHKTDMMERFYAQYDIPVAPGSTMQNTLRQQAKRIYERGKTAHNRRTKMEGGYFDYVPVGKE